ncbi:MULTISPECIES: epoxide hydrolase family protein [unclassified Mesorhizobium]|uniref:epoxide hydrolase family protein n=2 Tax=Mesorhizobium TaxID=68287 RepID=UPI0011297E4D|nr:MULTISPECIES: epoxide hydrolase family protein [unclassified Mesorhizobium]MCA0002242.1 epoxide hydrolase [Mesorhizobium sp. B264B2A]MCA0008943.1 epoxide hydrolase [Mesorhizobium sp. B264B1B]MCA0017060.1 epoxide hydrolase [Mesorhizobium sp. B264B1A]TPJ43911.1 epoxide hydrolase [Mesorhizobium sp. B2-6-6]
MITPFQIPYDADQAADLRSRLARTRWADAVTDDWTMGTERGVLNQFIDFWRDGYDWAQRRDRLNQLPHFRTTVDGHGIHFLHFRSGQRGSIPLLLMNGWPSSFVEFQRIAPLLTQGTPAFDVVIPTMPGFGYSDRPTRPYEAEPSDLYPKLMTMLGYGRFLVAGTDIGSGLATRIALRYPARLLALHVSAVAPKPIPEDASPLSKAEIDYDERLQLWSREEGGYQAIQSSRPQTLAFGLADSPVGLASWIVEKFRAWTDCDGDVFSVWPLEALIDTVMIYWMTNTIGSSVRYYYDAARLRPPLRADDFVHVPTAVAMWPHDLALAPRERAERLYNVRSYTVFPRGGHFPAWETPELYADDLRKIALAAI